jgi:hypothetical protein
VLKLLRHTSPNDQTDENHATRKRGRTEEMKINQIRKKERKEKKKKEIHIWKCNHFLPIQSFATFPTGVYV